MSVFGQGGYGVRMDWGPTGALASGADLSIVVDVLSFSTSVTIATERGSRVYPCPWRDPRAAAYADRHDAVLAVGRLEAVKAADAGLPVPPSLSPAGLLTAPAVARLVLPSPNGSTICSLLRDQGSRVAIGCLRNATAVADHAAAALRQGQSVALVAAGECWRVDDSLRPALEDLLGVGAIASRLQLAGFDDRLSPEARAAARTYAATADELVEVLHSCVGGRELCEKGFPDDVLAAAALDASPVVPVLDGDALTVW